MKPLNGTDSSHLPLSLRLLHRGTVNQDQVLKQLRVCSVEEQVFDVVGRNKAKLTVNHVSLAVEMLWQFQKERPELLRTVELIKSHPQFLTLRVLAENKIAVMEDFMLVDILYTFLRLNVDPHDSLVQQLVSEAWLRLDKFPMASLSKFAICLKDQHLKRSPLMGRIASIVDQKLSSIDDARVLSVLMMCISFLVSPRLRDALINKASHFLDTMDPSDYNNARRVVQFLHYVKYNYQPLLEKCNQILLRNISKMDAKTIRVLIGLYEFMQFNQCTFRLAAKRRLIELTDSSTDPISFTKLFVTLAPMASLETRERLENTALLLADELSALEAMEMAETLAEIQSRNLSLLNKIGSVIQKNIHVYKPMELFKITQALYLLHYKNPKLITTLRNISINFLQRSVLPYEVTMLTRVLSMLPCARFKDIVMSRVDAVATQCNLGELSIISLAVAKWVRNDPSYCHNTLNKYGRLLQTLNRCRHKRLQKADKLDLMLKELKFSSGDWFEEKLLEETIVTLQRMMDQINWTNVKDLAVLLTRMNHLCPPLMDRISSVVIQDIDKIHHSAIYPTLRPFSLLNYDSPQADQLYKACIQRFTPHISSFEPYMLVMLGHSLALADYFPEVLIKEIFSINFLGKLDSQLETEPDAINMWVRKRLMELNRAVCLECPEFQVPWFHEHYCQKLLKKGNGMVSPVYQQIHQMLGEVLGGSHFVRIGAVSPYFYTIDFECKLDKHLQPLPYSDQATLHISDTKKLYWERKSVEHSREDLPPGAQRVAVDFLDSKCFCRHSHHMKGYTLIRKRHLEILGYRVVQIPHFEWNSMELSTQDALKEYLKKKIFRELSS
ncbi:FAST kinase domain-containing protein 1, mitochondrial isoform X2 [Betta splendens]|uniref:FAST kinase domain-containing protein 1, mitochondrial isoform X2 n=1 Tax=Betta splendens TaxID=158456 RepID=A0A9W2XGH9_BETSP|nr:FAST kinase domain-containing protein 1, mitochondrial isoform X2 [Betta splendens]